MQFVEQEDGTPDMPVTHAAFEDVFVFANRDDPGLYHYLPLIPSPVLTGSGKPSGQLFAAGDNSYLMLSAQWDLPAGRLEELRDLITSLHEEAGLQSASGSAGPDPVRLAFANVSNVIASLHLAPDAQAEGEGVLMERPSSGITPYNAMFNCSLTGDDREAAIAALNGRAGMLFISFSGDLSAPLTVGARLEGDLSAITDSDTLDAALQDGRATFTLLSQGAAAFDEQLRARAIAMLQSAAPLGGQSSIDVELGFETPLGVTATADVGRWFAESSDAAPAIRPTLSPHSYNDTESEKRNPR